MTKQDGKCEEFLKTNKKISDLKKKKKWTKVKGILLEDETNGNCTYKKNRKTHQFSRKCKLRPH